ncbi:nitrate- and nitrite sensing domain-containing protein [Actinoplanes sp. CA-252034]|uniref:sensor histidine kinase n=1 Tax=Actinoplanes sp. CA-252034 TaxID=3239906 RepID=UPI003D957B87
MSRRIRTIGAVLLVAFWAAAAVPAVTDAVRALADRITADRLDRPIDEAVLALEAERRLSVTDRPILELTAQRGRTDDAAERLRQADRSWLDRLTTSASDRTADDLLGRMEALTGLRASVDAGRLDRRETVTAYTDVIDPAGAAPQDTMVGGILALSRSREILAEEDALLAAVSAGRGPTDDDRIRLTRLAGARRVLFTTAGAALPDSAARRHRDVAGSTAMIRLQRIEDDLAASSDGIPDPSAWSPAFNELNTALWDLQDSANREAADAATPRAVTATVWAGAIGGIGLVALLGLLIAARRGRGAGTSAATTAQTTAVSGPWHRPGGLLQDLDRRNQGLLQRQLRLLDALARRAGDEETAADLRRAGNFGTRLRRNVEKGITLTGGVPERQWQRLVPMTDVVRDAAAEIGDHDRIAGTDVESAYLAGTAATDLIHLLAELLENAATFAPADSRIVVDGRHDPSGYLLTVTDSGPGMTDDDLATGHEVMAAPEPPPGGTWWGLWATGRFAARQDVTVQLHNGFDGGLVAAVHIPPSLVTGRPANGAEPRADLQSVVE